MNAIRYRLLLAATLGLLPTGAALFAQDAGDAVLPPVPALPVAADGADDESPNWRDDVEADRLAKGWGPPRGPSQNWGQRYTGRVYGGGADRWDRYDRDRVRPTRLMEREEARRVERLEDQARAYQQLYWMMKARIDAERDDR